VVAAYFKFLTRNPNEIMSVQGEAPVIPIRQIG